MKIYLVGGAVRDGLLGIEVAERDWVVVGASEKQMLQAGYRRADAEFPVFLHPESGEEYALARREQKTAQGYRGFSVQAGPDVGLEEDLQRRDLTINAIAQDEAGQLIDPFGGQADIQARRLRHVSAAFVEDPVRLLRIARFAARFGELGFRVAHETQRLLRVMVDGGEVEALLPERVWKELQKALGGSQPWRFVEVLGQCGALAVLWPGAETCFSLPIAGHQRPEAHGFQAVAAAGQRAQDAGLSEQQQLAVLFATAGVTTEQLGNWVPLPKAVRRHFSDVSAYHELLCRFAQYEPVEQLAGLQALQVFRGDHRLSQAVASAAAVHQGCDHQALSVAVARLQALNPQAIAAETGLSGAALGAAIETARLAVLSNIKREG